MGDNSPAEGPGYVTSLVPTKEIEDIPQGHRRCRRWIGKTDEGIVVDLYVVMLRVATDEIEAFESTKLGSELEGLPTMPDNFMRPREKYPVLPPDNGAPG